MWVEGSEHSVTFVGGGVCDDVGTLGGAAFPGAAVIQVQRHLLRYESVQVHIVQSVSPPARV